MRAKEFNSFERKCTFPSALIWRPRLLWFKLELLTLEDELDEFETLLISVPLPPDVLLSLFCVPGRAGKSSLLIVNSVVSAAGVLIIPTKGNQKIKKIKTKNKSLCWKNTHYNYRNSTALLERNYLHSH